MKSKAGLVAFVAAMLLTAASAHAATATVSIKEGNDEPVAAISVTSDGAYILVGDSLDNSNNNSYPLITNNNANGDTYVSLIGWKGMFAAIPDITSSGDIVSATLKLYQRGPLGGEVIAVDRVTTDWLVNDNGSNETVVTGTYIDGASTAWAAGASTGFSSSDYTTEDEATFTIAEANYNRPNFVDVTEMVKDMYDSGNYGFALRLVSPQGADPWFQGDEQNDLGDDGLQARPTLYISYTTSTTYALTVDSGSGDGSYALGEVVTIMADAAPSGEAFDQWIGDTASVVDVYAPVTDITMPAASATVTATFGVSYTLTVNSGTGGGSYLAGRVVAVAADAPASGDVFVEWIGDTADLGDPADPTTNVTMPAAAVEITATYAPATLYTLTVDSGSGDGSYEEDWVVDITADPAPTGLVFAEWIGDTEGCADVYADVTTYTMPAANAEITAAYDTLYTLTVNSGTGDGDYVPGTDVNIVADDPPPAGKKFYKWEGDVATVDDIYLASATLTMPSANAEVTATWQDAGELIVDWGDEEANNVYDFQDWNTVLDLGQYTEYVSDGPAGLKAGSTGTGMSGCVGGSSYTFPANAKVVVTWYNIGSGSLTFNPEISFTSSSDHPYGTPTPAGWYAMTQVVCPGGESRTSTFTFDSETAGSYSLVNVCRFSNGSNNMVMDKIEYIESTPVYALTVNSGSGSGTYAEATVVDIVADPGPTGEVFDEWIGDTDNVADVGAASTTITMPGQDAEVTATYRAIEQYGLTVNSGSGSGTYDETTPVPIVADAAASGDVFDQWIGDIAGVDDAYASSTTLTMPRSNAEITATYRLAVSYTLTVDNGTGGGTYLEQQVVPIAADAAPSGEVFDKWIGDAAGCADVYDATTDYTMPSSNATVTATYKLANWIAFREGDTSVTATPFDDIQIRLDSDYTSNSSYAMTVDDDDLVLFGIKEMFDYLPVVDSGEVVQVESATLTLYRYGTGDVGDSFDFYRIRTEWLYDPAGSNETDVNGLYAEVSSSTEWSAGNFALSEDLDLGSKATDTVSDATYNGENPFDVTSAVQAIYTAGRNQGLCMHSPNDRFVFRGSERTESPGVAVRPLLEISYNRVAASFYSLTVNSGSGSGTYAEGMEAVLVADTPATGELFSEWIGDVAGILDVNSATTYLTMPDSDAEVTATYVMAYTLTVNSGTGSGDYITGEIVDIAAGAAPAGQEFDAWVGDVGTVADVNADTTTITMPASDAEITATYTDLPAYALTVNSGSGSGTYWEGQVVSVTADAAPSGLVFAEWIGDVAYVADVYAASTTVTMPAVEAEITATYADAYTLTVNSGSGSGIYPEGVIVDVAADDAPTDMVFAEWIGDTDGVANVTDPTTTVTMPAGDVEITATYTDAYTLTVNTGTGSGDYAEGAVVSVVGDQPAPNTLFDQWVGDTDYVANVYSRGTTVTMPALDIEITSTYKPDLPVGTRVKFREGGGSGYIDVLFDDTYFVLDPADSTARGTEQLLGIVDGPVTGEQEYDERATLIGVKDLFTELPLTSGGEDIIINNARLIIYRYQGPLATPFDIARVTTNWLPDDAGSNENDCSALFSENSTYTDWANFLTGFGPNDYDGDNALSVEIQDGGYNAQQMYDITSLVQSIYSEGVNYGLALIGEPGHVSPDPEYYGINFRSSEYSVSEPAYHPVLQIDYQYGVTYTLTVNSGSGSGDYAESAVVEIVADAHPSGDPFAAWVGDTGVLTDPNAATTDVTMPASDVEVTATYAPACVPPNGDLDGSGFVGQGDLDIVLDQWGNSGGEITDPRADPSGDDFVGQADLDIVLDDWGKSCEDD